jgi:hypothetical protein
MKKRKLKELLKANRRKKYDRKLLRRKVKRLIKFIFGKD